LDNLKLSLKKHFGFNEFKNHQESVIKNLLEGNDSFVIMPTGGGKSLCYQLPALIMDGTAIVISPLIALMKKNTPRIRYYLGKHAHMKRIPELRFLYDDSFETAMRTEHLLRSTRKTEA